MTQTATLNHGYRLLPQLVDKIAESNPDQVLYALQKTKYAADGFQDVSARVFAQAVNRCAWFIEKNLGRGQDFPTLTYLGPQDLVYGILVLACNKTGYKMLFNSPRNTLKAHLSLFEKTDCNTFLLPSNFALPVVQQILDSRAMRIVETPNLQHWLEDGPVDPYPYTKSFAEARFDPLVVMHTSGTTGLPKPIIETHGTASPIDAFQDLPSLGQELCWPAMFAGLRLYNSFPLFHCGGILHLLAGPAYYGYTLILGHFPPTAASVNGVHVHGNVQNSFLPPAILVDLAKEPEYLENLSRLHMVSYGGGALPRSIGDLINTKTRLVNCYGSTECGMIPCCPCDPEDWFYIRFNPIGYEFREVAEGLYEQFIVRDPELDKYQGIFATFPELNEWSTKDLYSKHPTKEDTWLLRGRTDDIIVYSTGEKLNPIDIEGIIQANPAVSAALVHGNGKFQSSLLIELVKPPTNELERTELLEAIWQSVQSANKESPSYGCIHRNMITFTSSEKPMLRAGKGTVQRKMTLDLYQAELDALYGSKDGAVHKPSKDKSDIHISLGMDVAHVVRDIIATCTDINTIGLPFDTDLFELGLDSLQVIIIARQLSNALSLSGSAKVVEPRTVYSNPSIAALTIVVGESLEGHTTKSTETHQQKMQRLYNLHAGNMPISAREAQPKQSDQFVVLLTGSTGSLGSYILDSLLSNPRISKIYCLNRGTGSIERQKKSQAAKGLQPLTDKVHCLDIDFHKPCFNLPIQGYKRLLSEVTTVIHNAWQVDFNLSVDSFAQHISTVQRFIEFSAHSKFGASLFFISSVSAVSRRPGTILEEVYEDWDSSSDMGYAQSKFISERLLDTAAREADIHATICRVGQVAGPTTETGDWSKQEWLPSLIISSKFLGKLPSSLGKGDKIEWIPVDLLGHIIVELATKAPSLESVGAEVYHAVNPQNTQWTNLVPLVMQSLIHEGSVELVSPEEWVEALRGSISKTTEVAQNPAIKIIEMYERLLKTGGGEWHLDTRLTVGASPKLATLRPIDGDLMRNWLRQWRF